jgi:hypothetical protein
MKTYTLKFRVYDTNNDEGGEITKVVSFESEEMFRILVENIISELNRLGIIVVSYTLI